MPDARRIIHLIGATDGGTIDDGLDGENRIVRALRTFCFGFLCRDNGLMNTGCIVDEIVAIVPTAFFSGNLVVHQTILTIIRELSAVGHPCGEI